MLRSLSRPAHSTVFRFQTILLLVAVLVTLLGGALPANAQTGEEPSPSPTIQSDKPDYAPGELVTLTGSNWQPGEIVNIDVNDDQAQTWRRNVEVVAGANGNITDSFNLPDWFVATYSVTATGPLSGTATTYFTDGNVQVRSAPSGVAFDYTIKLYGGSTNCTAGAGTTTTKTAVSGNPPSTTGVGANESALIEANLNANAPNAAATFSHWTRPNNNQGASIQFASGYSDTDRTVCVVGFQAGSRDLIGHYAVNNAPAAVDDAYSTDEDTTLNEAAPGVLGNDTDADGDALWATGNSPIDDVDHGTLTLNSDGSFSYDPDADFNGTDSFTYKATDGSLESDAATVTITVDAVNDAPAAVDDAYSTDEDTVLTKNAAQGVLANDTDPDGDALTATLVSGPSNGTVTMNSDGSFTYTPSANFNGTDSFTYKAKDPSNAASNVATVAITVNAVNDAPVNTVPGAQSTDEDTAMTFSAANSNAISLADVDVAETVGGQLRVTLSVDHGTLTLSETTGLIFTTGDGTAGATMTFTGAPAAINTALEGMSYQPSTNYHGPDTLTVTTNDQGNTGSGGAKEDQDTVAITVNAVNDAPVAVNDSATTQEDTPAAIDVVANDTDVEGDNLSVKADSISTPAHGTATLITTGPNAGQILYTPAADYFGPDSFTYKVCDDGTSQVVNAWGGVTSVADAKCSTTSATVAITVTEVNDPPVAGDDAATVAEDSDDNEIDVLANDSPGPANESSQALTVGSITDGPDHGSASVDDKGTTDPSDDIILYSPDDDYFGTDSLTYQVCDDGTTNGVADHKCDTADVAITVTAVNDPPVVTAGADQAIDENDTVNVSATFTDVEADDMHTCTIDWGEGSPTSGSVTEPSGGNAGTCSGSHTYLDDNPTGTSSDNYTVKITVTDDGTTNGASDPKSGEDTLTVTVGNLDPTTSSSSFTVDPFTGQATASFNFDDVGTQDTHTATFSWSHGLAGSGPSVAEANGEGSASETRTLPSGCYNVSVSGTVTDDDLGTSDSQPIVTGQQVDVYSIGFAPPIKANERNIAKYGNVLPVKVRFTSSCTGASITSSIPLYLSYVKGVGASIDEGTEVVSESVSNADGSGGLMRIVDSMHIYNFTTKALMPNQDYTLRVRYGSMSGPILLSAVIQPKK